MNNQEPPTKPTVRKRLAQERGHVNHGWLDARFTFSFAHYHNPEYMGFRALQVINNDTIEPNGGFPLHHHTNMEIFTYVIKGELEHGDSLGNGATLTPGKLQYMSAAKGIRHSEFNPSPNNQTHLYQIWLKPNQSGGEPRYMEKSLDDPQNPAKQNALTLLYSGSGRDGSTPIRQNAEILFGKTNNQETEQPLTLLPSQSMPHAWIQVISGTLEVLGETLNTADGLAIENAPQGFSIQAKPSTKFLLFRLS